jgi:SNF2 family DNA or RNA helicase
VIEGLEVGLGGHGVHALYGPTPKELRHELVEKFQSDPAITGMIMQIQIAESVELTAASNVWFVESDWTPKTMHQAVSRSHRYGQRGPVNARVLALEGSIDVAIARVLERKMKSIEAVIESETAA